MIPLHSITLFCDSPDFGSCLFFVSGLAKVVSLLLFKVSADWALSNIRDFLFSCSSFIFRIARFDFLLSFFPSYIPRDRLDRKSEVSFIICVWICFRYCFVSRIRIWFWSHIWFFFWVYIWFFFWVYIWFFSRGYFRF